MLPRREGPKDLNDILENSSFGSRFRSQGDLWNGSKTPTNNVFGVRKDFKSSLALKIRSLTPSRNWDFRGLTDGDRYIPQRDSDQMDLARYKISREINNLNKSSSAPTSPAKMAGDALLRAS
uniref:Uncharacterized protein n=1 Tax=Panagrolaimus sp. JU765 TaxID=591449 RepID=A0AC34Q410_9BILA